MKKILAVTAALAIATIMLVAPVGTASTTVSFEYTVNPIAIPLGPLGPNTTLPNGLPLCKSTGLGNIVCYSPKFVRKAYSVPSSLDGSGQTIVIVDAFGSPTIRQDLALFDLVFGLCRSTLTTISKESAWRVWLDDRDESGRSMGTCNCTRSEHRPRRCRNKFRQRDQ